MKLQLNPIFETLSGKLKNLVFVSKKLVTKDNKTNENVYIRSYPKKRQKTSILQDNLNIALKIIVQNFKDLKSDETAYQTWKDQAKQMEEELDRSLTAYLLFSTYYLTKYTHTLGSEVLPKDLSNGTSLNWEHRNTRSWIN